MTAAAGMDMIEAEMRCPAICGKLGLSRKLVPNFEAPCIAITRSFSSTKIRREKGSRKTISPIANCSRSPMPIGLHLACLRFEDRA